MSGNDSLLALRIPSKIKERLERMYPDTKDRNNAIRAALKKITDKELVITSYEISVQANL